MHHHLDVSVLKKCRGYGCCTGNFSSGPTRYLSSLQNLETMRRTTSFHVSVGDGFARKEKTQQEAVLGEIMQRVGRRYLFFSHQKKTETTRSRNTALETLGFQCRFRCCEHNIAFAMPYYSLRLQVLVRSDFGEHMRFTNASRRRQISVHTIRNAWSMILIPLAYFDVMHMKALRKIIPPEFSDVMIT